MRLFALRVAAHLPPPKLSDSVTANGASNQSTQKLGQEKVNPVSFNTFQDISERQGVDDHELEFDVVAVCLEVASIEISIVTEREYVRRVQKLEVLVRGGRLPGAFNRFVCRSEHNVTEQNITEQNIIQYNRIE